MPNDITNLEIRQSASRLAKTLSDNGLRILMSEVRREIARRKAIAHNNATWTANDGLEYALKASLKKMFNENE